MPRTNKELEELKERATKAAKRLVEMKGAEVIAEDFMGFDFVFKQDGEIAFAKCFADYDRYPEGKFDRGEFEQAMTEFLKENQLDGDFRIRCDHFEVHAINPTRALVRHHVNVEQDE